MDARKVILGGFALLTLVTGFKAYKLSKVRKTEMEQEIIEIEPETIEDSRK